MDINTKFSLMDRIPLKDNTFFNSINDIYNSNNVIKNNYFSQQNISNIEQGIKNLLLKHNIKSYNINNDELIMNMKIIYNENYDEFNNNSANEIEKLNNKIINLISNNIYKNNIQYNKYIENINYMHTPIDRPIYSNYKNNSLEPNSWL
tara:strand:- start:24079 stop:24525 length:447 start_codon:yes stop_codon:yes gene_type:complete